jgi:hypothetical protein
MIINKIKTNRGSALIICIAILLFLSILGATNFNVSRSDLKMSASVYASNLLFQASESGIDVAITEEFEDTANIDKLIQMDDSDILYACRSYTGNIEDNKNCLNSFYNSNKSIKNYAEIKRSKEKECLAYGNSEQKAYCFVIRSVSELPTLDNKKEVHVQEMQINTVNLNNNGVFEL